ncbi:MAG TPA: hypothetical protein VE861_13725 [Gemmatimonadaceae bacterium]|nr:hypothetical protein [Gemmatimonadaceae bacterium]
MSGQLTYGSIREWPGTTKAPRGPATFKMKYSDSKQLLLDELRRAGARNATLALDINHGDLNRFGELYADAKPSSSRVLLTFTRTVAGAQRTLSFPCWQFLAWQHNMHAIALTLEALRSVERYGATQQDQQWKGFAALGSGDDTARAINTQALALSPERAARILVEAHPTMGASAGGMGIEILAKAMLDRTASAGMMKLAHESRSHAHPDRSGNDGLFATVNAAFDVLKAYHRGQA